MSATLATRLVRVYEGFMMKFTNRQLSGLSRDVSALLQACQEANWIEIKLIDEQGNPCKFVRYGLFDSENSCERSGTLDENGFAREENLGKLRYYVIFGREDYAGAEPGDYPVPDSSQTNDTMYRTA